MYDKLRQIKQIKLILQLHVTVYVVQIVKVLAFIPSNVSNIHSERKAAPRPAASILYIIYVHWGVADLAFASNGGGGPKSCVMVARSQY